MKKVICWVIIFCYMVVAIGLGDQKISASSVECALFPGNVLQITQGAYGSYSHSNANAIDLVGNTNYFAPFSGTITAIKPNENAVVLQSDSPVYWANGKYDYMSVLFMHDNDISDLYVGKHINQGENFYQPGTKGYASGSHVHLCVRAGKDTYLNGYGSGNVYAYDALFLQEGTKIVNDYGYNWEYASIFAISIAFDANGGSLEVPKAEYSDVQFNTARGEDMMVIFTGGGNTGTNTYGSEAIVDSTGKVTEVVYGVGNATIPSGGFVISGHRAASSWIQENIKVGDYASYNTETKKLAIGTKNACLAYGKQVSDKYGELPVPTRDGYAFDGWYTTLSGGEKITAESSVTNKSSHTLYAKWSMAPIDGKYPYVTQMEYDGKRCVLYDAPIPWDKARDYCGSMGGHLATIATEDEAKFIKSFIDSGSQTGYWLGGTDEADNQWKWITGESFEYTDWYTDQPDNSGNREHYLEIRKDFDYQWNDDTIDKYTESALITQGFICEFEEEPVGVEYYYNGNKYIRFDIPLTWSGAESYCFLLGGNLVSVETTDENEFIKSIVKDGTQTGYWLGGTDAATEGDWYWMSGETFEYSDWNVDQPDNSGDREHYLEMRKDYDYQWNDDSIDKYNPTALLTQGFICEIENYITEPYVNADVEKNGDVYSVRVESGNIEEGKIYVAGYNNENLVDVKLLHSINSVEATTLNGNIKKIKVMVWNELTPVIDAETIIKAEWGEDDGVVWILKELAPDGVDIIDRKYTYDLTTYTESEESVLDGWECYDIAWVERESGSFNYASFPSGFDKNSSYYKNFKTATLSAYENETEKCEVSTSHKGYIYWHWCRNSYTNGPINRWVEDAYKSTSMGNFYTFHAFDSETNATTSDGDSCYQYSNGNACKDSYWYYKLPYYSCTYTKYNKLFKYSKVESVESDSYPTDGNASNIKEWVCYIK